MWRGGNARECATFGTLFSGMISALSWVRCRAAAWDAANDSVPCGFGGSLGCDVAPAAWHGRQIPKGAAKPVPDRMELSKEELLALQQQCVAGRGFPPRTRPLRCGAG